MKTLDEHADWLIKEIFSLEPATTNSSMLKSHELHIKYLSSPEFEQSKKNKDYDQLRDDTFHWIGDECDSVMVDVYDDEREAWLKENPDEDEYAYEYSQDAYEYKDELMGILLHKLYGATPDWDD
tara:strand:- start:235 stop:609 length:375 start_codon:yes stop_codon:yes gene_type:complete